MKKGTDFFYFYHFGLVIVMVISVVLTLRKIFRQKPMPVKEEPDYLAHIPSYYEKPRVYRVRDNPDYVVYEFYDKYQLFFEGKNGLEYIRTDYKDKEDESMKMQ